MEKSSNKKILIEKRLNYVIWRVVLPCWVWDDCPRFYPPMWREILQPFCTANSRILFRQQPKILSLQSLRRWILVLPLCIPNFPVSEHSTQRNKQTKIHMLKQFRNHKQYFLLCATTNLNNYKIFTGFTEEANQQWKSERIVPAISKSCRMKSMASSTGVSGVLKGET